MTPLMNSLACLLSVAFAMFLWKEIRDNRFLVLRETLLLVGFLLMAGTFTFLAGDMQDPALEHYPFRMLGLCLCCSTTSLRNKRRKYLVLAQVFWLWVELFGGITLFYHGLDMPWTRITAIASMAACSTLLSKISREMEFCLMVFWIAVWIFF